MVTMDLVIEGLLVEEQTLLTDEVIREREREKRRVLVAMAVHLAED
jgi:hypothetical protein